MTCQNCSGASRTPLFKTTYGNFAPRLASPITPPSSRFTNSDSRGFGVFYDLATSEMATWSIMRPIPSARRRLSSRSSAGGTPLSTESHQRSTPSNHPPNANNRESCMHSIPIFNCLIHWNGMLRLSRRWASSRESLHRTLARQEDGC